MLATLLPRDPIVVPLIPTQSSPIPAPAVTMPVGPATPDQAWLREACAHGSTRWIANVRANVSAERIGDHEVPVTVLAGPPSRSSYVGSPRAAWISYPFSEAQGMVDGWRRPFAGIALQTLATPLAAAMALGRLDRAAVIGNHLVSTNLHPAFSGADLAEATPRLAARFSGRPLVLRNVCPAVDAVLTDGLRAAGWRLIPARQIYLCDPRDPALWKHNHLKRDVKALGQPDLELVGPEAITAADLPAMRTAFRQLFLGKHCALNPDYTDEFFALCRNQRFLDLYALRLDGRAVGVLGVYQRHGWVTTPLIGYDTTLPQELGVYRRLMALLFKEAKRRDCRLHLSSGAGGFKSARGGVPHLEYTAVYSSHLIAPRRTAIAAFAAGMDRLVPWALARAEPAKAK